MILEFRKDDCYFTYLTKNDPILGDLISSVGDYKLVLNKNYYVKLVSSIIGQQLSVKAASTIFTRVEKLCQEITPQNILAIDDEDLRGVGVSWSKIKYIKHLSEEVVSNRIDLDNLDNLSDEEVIYELTKMKGIGRWTAEMFLIFSLGRMDIFSTADAGLRRSIKLNYGLEDLPSNNEMVSISNVWQPYRTVASLYLWASLDNNPQ